MRASSVLIVEDNPTTRKMFRVALQAEGLTAVEASDGAGAIALMTSEPADLVLLDMVLPDAGGVDVARRVRALPGGARVPIVAMSGFQRLLDEARQMPGVFDAFLFKPVDLTELVQVLRTLLPIAASPALADDRGRGRRFLLVDDDPVQLKLARIRMGAHVEHVMTALDVPSALAQARSTRPDLILSDVLMPGADGFELCLAVRQDPDLADIPVVLVSSHYEDPADRKLAMHVGASAFLPRTPDLEELVPALFDLLARNDAPLPVAEPIERLRSEHADRVSRQLDRQLAFSAELVQRAALQAAQLSILNGVASALTRSADVEAELADVLATCIDAGGIDRCALYRSSGASLRLSHVVGFPEALRGALEDGLGAKHLVAKVIAEGAALPITSPPLDPEEASRFLARAGVLSAMIVPLTGGGRCAGALLFGASTSIVGAAQLAFGRAIGAYVGQALVLAETFAQERAARAAAEEASRAKDEFLAMLGHELRNPLAPILTVLHMLRQRAGPTPGREHDVLDRQVKHLTRLVDDLLDVSRIACGKVELQRACFEVALAVTDAVEMAGPIIEARQHRLTVDVAESGLAVDADRARLSQILFNLLGNAAKFTPNGGHIALSAWRDGGDVVLRVKDSGIGIAPELLPTIFDRFTQARQSLDRAQGGLGLGLSIAHNLVTLHGGTVHAHSEGAGRGTELTVRLPAAPDTALHPASEASRSSGPPPDPDALHILIVDDNLDAAELLADLMESLGYTTRVAHDGPTALRLAQEAPPDVALLDIGLPGMNGYELGRHLRKLPGLSKLPLVAITGYGQDSDRRQSRAAGFDRHLVKPVDVHAIAALVTQLASAPPSID